MKLPVRLLLGVVVCCLSLVVDGYTSGKWTDVSVLHDTETGARARQGLIDSQHGDDFLHVEAPLPVQIGECRDHHLCGQCVSQCVSQ